MKTSAFRRAAFASALLLGLAACSKKDDNKPDAPGGAANTVSGTVLDSRGKPVAGAKIRAENPTGSNMHIDGVSGADGTYKLQLSAIGGWKVYAWKESEFNGKPYVFRMGMPQDADYVAFAPGAKAVTRDFVWKMSGRIPDRPASPENGTGYFGGSVKFINFNTVVAEMPAGTDITVTLTPEPGATFADGSSAEGKVVTRTFTLAAGAGQAYYIHDIPLTTYTVTAKTGSRTVYLGANDADNLYKRLRYTLPPAPGAGGSYESGLGAPNEHPFYMAID